MKTITYAPFLALMAAAAVNCIDAQVSDDDVCDSRPISFTTPSDLATACQALSGDPTLGNTSYTAPPVSTTTSFDFSGALSDVNKITSSFNVQVNQLMLESPSTEGGNQFSSVSSVEIDIQGSDTTKYPLVELAHYATPSTGVGNFLNFTLDMPNSVVLDYLRSGTVQLTITVDNNAMTLNQACSVLNTGTVSSDIHMCLGVAASYKKTL